MRLSNLLVSAGLLLAGAFPSHGGLRDDRQVIDEAAANLLQDDVRRPIQERDGMGDLSAGDIVCQPIFNGRRNSLVASPSTHDSIQLVVANSLEIEEVATHAVSAHDLSADGGVLWGSHERNWSFSFYDFVLSRDVHHR